MPPPRVLLAELTALAFLMNPTEVRAQSRAGDDFCYDHCYHTWTFVDDNNKWVLLDGLIKSATYNLGPKVLSSEYATQVGQGTLPDRKNEHLGRSDQTVIMKRKVWERELRALAEGRPLKEWTERAGLADMSEVAVGSGAA